MILGYFPIQSIVVSSLAIGMNVRSTTCLGKLLSRKAKRQYLSKQILPIGSVLLKIWDSFDNDTRLRNPTQKSGLWVPPPPPPPPPDIKKKNTI